jgi:hypothetical protein
LGNLALYLDYMASGARPLQKLAADGLLPKPLAALIARLVLPFWRSADCRVNALLVIGPFQSLVIIDVLLMVASYALIFLPQCDCGCVEPGLPRPFKNTGW